MEVFTWQRTRERSGASCQAEQASIPDLAYCRRQEASGNRCSQHLLGSWLLRLLQVASQLKSESRSSQRDAT